MLTAKDRIGYQIGLAGLVRFTNILGLAGKLKEIEPKYYPFLLLVILLSLLSAPLRLLESLAWRAKLQKLLPLKDPVIILGHWRSGTTMLHNILAQDRSFGYIDTYQCLAPECTLSGGVLLSYILRSIFPPTRPMDQVGWHLDSPQEDEIALSKMIPWGFYLSFFFPRDNGKALAKAIDMNLWSDADKTEIKSAYLKMLGVATLRCGGKRLLLKNPVSTARIKFLLELFPNAKFIHIARSPYDVFCSTVNLHIRLSGIIGLQSLGHQQAMEITLNNYEVLMRRYLSDRHLIPKGRLVEVCFEDLESTTLFTIKRIYRELSLDMRPETLHSISSFIKSQSEYQKNQFSCNAYERALINKRWGFAFKPLGYRAEAIGSESMPE